MRKSINIFSRKISSLSLLNTTALSIILLAGCGGGGSDVDRFRTAEFNRSTGLKQIKAAKGYARITGEQGGNGVRIAVIDNGIDTDHPDLAGVVLNSISVQSGQPLVDGFHGTPVAGVIAARKNGSGTHGVAFNSTIINIQANDGSEFIDDDDTTTGILTAAGAPGGLADGETDIMNLSLRADRDDPSMLAAMQAAAARDKIMVIASGNDGGQNPQFPARHAIDPEVNGLAIAVGATTLDIEETSFTDRCGVARDVCLFAPGQDITAPEAGGGTRTVSGTSFAAPMVAGAAAVVKAAFPGITSRDVVARLLSTATPLDINNDGVIDNDDINIAGHGLLNLENALDPQGTISVATGSTLAGTSAPLDESALSLGSSFAFRGAGADLLERAVAFDADGFPFAVDLFNKTKTQSRDTGLAAFLDSSKTETSHQETAFGTFSFQLAEDRDVIDPHRAEFTNESAFEERDERVIKAGFHSEVSKDFSVFGMLNQTSTVDAGLQKTLAEEGGGFLQPGAFLTPYDSLAGAQSGGGLTYALGETTKLTIAAFTSGEGEDNPEASLQKIELSHKTVGDVELRLGYGWLTENDRFLGSGSKGAFGSDGSGSSQYVNLSLIAPITEKLRLFGAYSSGWTDISTGDGRSSLFDGWSEVRSDAFGIGLAATDVLEEEDGLTLMVGQPLRVREGAATATVPVGRTDSGDVIAESGKIDLSPGGQEITTEMAYRFALDDQASSLSAGAFVRLNPDHDPDADPDLGIGMRYQLKF